MLEKGEKQLLHIYSGIPKKRNHKIKILVLKENVFFLLEKGGTAGVNSQ